MNPLRIENVTAADAEELLGIYSYYVLNTAVSFETTPPSIEEFISRIETYTVKYPYIKAVDENGKITGFAFAHAFRERAAYDKSVESSIYVDKDSRRKGVGRLLYTELENRLKADGYLNMYACVATLDGKESDPYLTEASPEFHRKMGFTSSGVLHNCGIKFGRWYSMMWMEKIIGEHLNQED